MLRIANLKILVFLSIFSLAFVMEVYSQNSPGTIQFPNANPFRNRGQFGPRAPVPRTNVPTSGNQMDGAARTQGSFSGQRNHNFPSSVTSQSRSLANQPSRIRSQSSLLPRRPQVTASRLPRAGNIAHQPSRTTHDLTQAAASGARAAQNSINANQRSFNLRSNQQGLLTSVRSSNQQARSLRQSSDVAVQSIRSAQRTAQANISAAHRSAQAGLQQSRQSWQSSIRNIQSASQNAAARSLRPSSNLQKPLHSAPPNSKGGAQK